MADMLADIQFDDQGFMVDPQAWSPEIAAAIAAREGLTLTDRHWVVINFARDDFKAQGDAPSLRRITRETDVNTKELYQLFLGSPGKLAAKVAGLHKPTGCI